MRILFVTYDGPQVSYLESLFLPIFQGLQAKGVTFDVLQFRWGDKESAERIRQTCEAAGSRYRAVPIWRFGGGAGPFLSSFMGGRHVRRAVRAFGSDAIMPRSLMPAISTLAAGGSKLRPIVFDADGLAADERVDVAGLSPTSATYRILRDVEAQAVRVSKSVIVRSDRAAEILCSRAGPPVGIDRFHTVVNGRDETLFHPGTAEERRRVREALGIDPSAPVTVYAGSVGPQYRFDLVAAFAAALRARHPDARLLVLTAAEEEARAQLGAGAEDAIIRKAAPQEVGKYLAAADVGLAFRSTGFSMQAVAPVKLSEYLLCGLPVVGTASIGDTGAAVEAGVFLSDELGSAAAADWFIEKVIGERDMYRERAREVGVRHFSLQRSVEDYFRAIEPLMGLG